MDDEQRVPAEPGAITLEDPDLLGTFAIKLDWRRWWLLIPEIVTLTATAALPMVVLVNVVSRYTNWYKSPWAEDIIRVLFLWVIFLGGALAVKYMAHVRIALLADRIIGARRGEWWKWVIRLSPIAMGLILTLLGIEVVELHMKRQLVWLRIPAGYFSTVIPASGALMIIYAIFPAKQDATISEPGL